MKKFALIALMAIAVTGCDSSGNDPAPIPEAALSFVFSQNFEGTTVTNADFDLTVYTNEKGHKMTFSRIRYLISRIKFVNVATSETYEVPGYYLIDMADPSTFNFDPGFSLPEGDYNMSFVYGFNEEDNVDGAYNDLNAASWNWPLMLGGGYHFLQFDGMFDVDTDNPKPFNYHNGTARVSDGVFEQNFYVVNVPGTVTITNGITAEIIMDIAEWFRNPYTWDLDVYSTPLMPNYDAQKLMNQNASTVFSVQIN